MATVFDDFPDDARLWINPVDRDLTDDEQERILEELEAFIGSWSSHGRKVLGKAAIVAGRFILIAAYIPGGDVSGCGIDASVHALGDIAQRIGFDWVSGLDVMYLADDKVRQADRLTFARLAEEGHVMSETVVFDFSHMTLGDMRRVGFGIPAGQSWHGRIFRFQTAPV